MPRPKADTVVYRIAFTFHREHDADLIELMEKYPAGSDGRQDALKAAWRSGLLPGGKAKSQDVDLDVFAASLVSMEK